MNRFQESPLRSSPGIPQLLFHPPPSLLKDQDTRVEDMEDATSCCSESSARPLLGITATLLTKFPQRTFNWFSHILWKLFIFFDFLFLVLLVFFLISYKKRSWEQWKWAFNVNCVYSAIFLKSSSQDAAVIEEDTAFSLPVVNWWVSFP